MLITNFISVQTECRVVPYRITLKIHLLIDDDSPLCSRRHISFHQAMRPKIRKNGGVSTRGLFPVRGSTVLYSFIRHTQRVQHRLGTARNNSGMSAYLCARDESMTLHDLSMNCKMGTTNKGDQYKVKKHTDNSK